MGKKMMPVHKNKRQCTKKEKCLMTNAGAYVKKRHPSRKAKKRSKISMMWRKASHGRCQV